MLAQGLQAEPIEPQSVPASSDAVRQRRYAVDVDEVLSAIFKAAKRDPGLWQSRTKFFAVVHSLRPLPVNEADYHQGMNEDATGATTPTWSAFFCHFVVNLCPLARLGTIEFRDHPGTLEAEEINRWVETLAALMQAAFQQPWVLELQDGPVAYAAAA